MSAGFFAVDRHVFVDACALGMNQACALLVIACGTGKNNRSSQWSAEAVGKYAGMRWKTAKEAIDTLLKADLLQPSGKSKTRPKYTLPEMEQPIWVPNSLIVGAADENTMLSRVRETGDPMTLRLLIELYSAQNLLEDGGISAEVTYKKHDRKKIGQVLQYVIWDFPPENQYVDWTSEVSMAHRRVNLTEQEREQGKNPGVDFFRRFGSLEKIGAVAWINYLYDSPNGEPLFPFEGIDGTEAEKALFLAVSRAGQRMIGDVRATEALYTVPVLSHIENVCMISVARLTHRPQTKLTAAWWKSSNEQLKKLADQYDQVYVAEKKVKEF